MYYFQSRIKKIISFIFHFLILFFQLQYLNASGIYKMKTLQNFDRSFQTQSCGKVSIDSNGFKPEEKRIIQRSVCFVQNLLGAKVKNHPRVVWSKLHKGTSEKKCLGLTYQAAFSFKKEVIIFVSTPSSSKKLIEYNQLGSTVLHEFHHYERNSSHDGSHNDPTEIYDGASLDAMMLALNQRLEQPVLCDQNDPDSKIKNMLQKLACECGIRFWDDSIQGVNL